MKRILGFFLTIVFLMNFTLIAIADESAPARTIVIFEVQGSNAKMTKGTEKEFNAKGGLKLFEGYTVSTGEDSYVYLKMDENSLLKIDSESKISISRASSSKLSVTVLSGSITVNAQEQKEGDVMEIRAGNSALAIRGTIFTVEQSYNNDVTITMLEGAGSVDGHFLPEGSTMDITDDKDTLDKKHIIRKSEIDESTSPVILRAIVENQEVLATHFTQDDIVNISLWLETHEQEEKTSQNQPSAAPEPDNNTAYYRKEPQTAIISSPESSEPPSEDDNDDSSYTPPPTPSYVAYIGAKGYSTLAEAILDAQSADNIRVTSSVAINSAAAIANGISLTVESPATLTANANLTVNGTLNVASGAAFVNNGILTNNSSNTVNIDGTFYNNDTFNNTHSGKAAIGSSGTLNLGGSAYFKNEGNLEINGSFAGNAGGRLIIGSTANVTGANPTLNGLTLNPGSEYQIGSDGKFSKLVVYNEQKGKYYASISEAMADSSDNQTITLHGSLTETGSGNIVIPEYVKLDIPTGIILSLTCSRLENNGYIDVNGGSNWNLTASDIFENYGIIEIGNAEVNLNCEVLNDYHIQIDCSGSSQFSVTGRVTNYTDGSFSIIRGSVLFASGLVNYGTFSLENGFFSIQGENDVVAISPVAGGIIAEPAPETPIVFINGNGASQTRGMFHVSGGTFYCKSIDNQYGLIKLESGYTAVSGNVYNTGGVSGQSEPLIIIGEHGALSVSRGGFYTTTNLGVRNEAIEPDHTYYYKPDDDFDPGWHNVY